MNGQQRVVVMILCLSRSSLRCLGRHLADHVFLGSPITRIETVSSYSYLVNFLFRLFLAATPASRSVLIGSVLSKHRSYHRNWLYKVAQKDPAVRLCSPALPKKLRLECAALRLDAIRQSFEIWIWEVDIQTPKDLAITSA